MSGTELAIILVLALLLLGPDKLPSVARTMGKAMRDFKRATDDVKGTVESEFYKMDQPETPLPERLPTPAKPEGTVAAAAPKSEAVEPPPTPPAGEPPKS